MHFCCHAPCRTPVCVTYQDTHTHTHSLIEQTGNRSELILQISLLWLHDFFFSHLQAIAGLQTSDIFTLYLTFCVVTPASADPLCSMLFILKLKMHEDRVPSALWPSHHVLMYLFTTATQPLKPQGLVSLTTVFFFN